jgi:hypothetical protein
LPLSLVRLRIAKLNDLAPQYCRARPDEGSGFYVTNARPVMTEYRFIAYFRMCLNLASPHLQNPTIYARFVSSLTSLVALASFWPIKRFRLGSIRNLTSAG